MTETFDMVPAASRLMWWIAGFIGLLLAGVMALLVVSAKGASASRFELSAEGLRIRGDLYGRMVPASVIRTSEARRVDFALDRGLAPARRTMGTSVPGYQSGWYRLRNDRKALLYLTDRSRAVYVPTSDNYDLVLSPEDPDRFVAALKSLPSSSR